MTILKNDKDAALFYDCFGKPDKVKYNGVMAYRYNNITHPLERQVRNFNLHSQELEAVIIKGSFFSLHFRK